MSRLFWIALCGLVMGCADQPEMTIVHQQQAVTIPAALNTCPTEIAQISAKTDADVAEIVRVNRAAYVDCRSTVQRILDYVKSAAEAINKTP